MGERGAGEGREDLLWTTTLKTLFVVPFFSLSGNVWNDNSSLLMPAHLDLPILTCTRAYLNPGSFGVVAYITRHNATRWGCGAGKRGMRELQHCRNRMYESWIPSHRPYDNLTSSTPSCVHDTLAWTLVPANLSLSCEGEAPLLFHNAECKSVK